MSNPTSPAAQNQQVSLGDITLRYLSALQRNFDITAYLVEGSRRVDERTYDEFSTSVRFQPSQRDRQGFDAAKLESERWLLKSLLAESLVLVVPLLEDLRSIAALVAWQAAGGQDQAALQKMLTADREAFLALDLAEKFTYLHSHYAIDSPLSASVLAMTKLGICLAARRGVVAEEDVTDGGALALTLVSLDLVPSQTAESGAPTLTPRVGELKRTFQPGETIHLEKPDYLNLITTLAIFVNSMMKSVQVWVQAKQGG